MLLFVLCAVTAVLNPLFLSKTNLTNLANSIGLFGIFSLGLGIVIITGGIDLSVGSVFALAGVLLAMMLTELTWPFASWQLKPSDINDVPALVEKLQQSSYPPSKFVWTQLPESLRQELASHSTDKTKTDRLQSALAVEFNRIITGESIYQRETFPSSELSSRTKAMIDKTEASGRKHKLNRLLLQDSFSGLLASPRQHWPWPVAVTVAVLIPMLLGWANGLLITRLKIQPFVVTLCGLLLYRGLARFIADDGTKGFGNAEGFQTLQTLSKGKLFGWPAPFVILTVITVVMWFVLHRSIYGRYLLAVGRNEESTRFSGVNTRWVVASSYVLAGVLTGISGILFAFYTNSISPSNHGNFYELYGIAAAVLGGCSLRGGEGSVIGIIIGTALFQVLQNVVNLLSIPSSLNFTVMGAVVLLGVLGDQFYQARAAKRLVRH